jgi:hypothetical protein
MKVRLLKGGLVACGVLITPLAGAEEAKPEQFDWPVQSLFLADVPQIQDHGAVQGRAGFHMRNTSEGTQLEMPLELEVGLGHRFQLASELDWSRERDADELSRGLSGVSVGVHYKLRESADTGFAMVAGLDGEFTRSEFGGDPRALYGRFLAFKQAGVLGLNATLRPGFAYSQEHQLEPRAELGLGATFGSGTVVPMTEVLAELGDERAVEASGGLKVKLGQAVELGAGALVGRRDGEGIFGATTSLLIDVGG